MDWPHVCRVVWLRGGLVAINDPGPSVYVRSGQSGPVLFEFRLKDYPTLFRDLARAGLSVVGATFIQDADEIRGLRPPEFRAWMGNECAWRVSVLSQQWGQIAYAAAHKDEMELMDVTSRIASTLRYGEMRLLNLLQAYSNQLAARALSGELKGYVRFKDLN